MKEKDRVKIALVGMCLDLVPPVMRDDLLSRPELIDRYSLDIEAVVNFGAPSASFKRSTLFSAVRSLKDRKGRERRIVDLQGREWTVLYGESAEVGVLFRSNGEEVRVRSLALIASGKMNRLKAFEEMSRRVNLPPSAASRWTEILRKRSLRDDEFGDIQRDIALTPVAVAETIGQCLSKASVSIEDLVPKAPEYYYRLVGRRSGQSDIRSYVDQVARNHIRDLIAWDTKQGLRLALLLAAHTYIVEAIAKESAEPEELPDLVNWAKGADAMSQGAVLEMAIQGEGANVEMDKGIKSLAEELLGEAVGGRYDAFELFSAAFSMVDGELSKTKIFQGEAPYWRRLAAVAQAALIIRCVIGARGDLTNFIAWMKRVRAAEQRIQTYADMRTEPRWLPEFAAPAQMRSEIGGRVVMAAAKVQETVKRIGLEEMLLGEGPTSFKARIEVLTTILSGPLEGGIPPMMPLPEDLLKRLATELDDEKLRGGAFNVAGTYALFCPLPVEVAEQVAEALRRSDYRIDVLQEKDFTACLLGLAVIAATTRCHRLADAVIVALRVARQQCAAEVDAIEAFDIGLVACASRSEMVEWANAVGRWICDCGFADISREDAEGLRQRAEYICETVPALWATSARGLAALEATAA